MLLGTKPNKEIRKKVLIACRADEVDALTHRLSQKGFRPLGVPIVDVTPFPIKPTPIEVDGIIFTSTAAVAATEVTKKPCYCVGPKTAEVAQKKGFQVVYIGAENGLSLAQWLVAHKKEVGHCLYHPTTQQPAITWYQLLQQNGFKVRHAEVYKTTLLKALPDEVVCCLKENDVSSLIAFSRRGGEHLLRLLKMHGVQHVLECVHVFVLSHAVATPFLEWGINPKHVFVAPAPTKETLFNVLEKQITN